VLAQCDAAGKLIADAGRVEIRYRPKDGRAYRAALSNLVVVEDAPILPGEACVEAAAVAPRKGKTVSSKSEPGSATFPAHATAAAAPAVVAYTDGACSGNPGPAGSGVVLESGDERRELSIYIGEATNNIAELSAIKCALKVIGKTAKSVRIYTDSRYSIGVLSQGWTAKANQALVQETKDALEEFSDVRLIYVPGHSGHPKNERADELAREAIRTRSSKIQRP
jgi:ribonuclease HI